METLSIFPGKRSKNLSFLTVLLFFSIHLVAQPSIGLEIDTAMQDGIRISRTGDDGVQITDAKFGIFVDDSDVDGILVRNSGDHGVKVLSSGGEGLSISSSGGNSIDVDGGTIGIFAQNTLNQGMLLQNVQGAGIDINGTGGDGITVINATGLAGKFYGNVDVTGTLTKGMGTFKIDHPLDPENQYLYHSFVESPDMMNIYNGVVTLDANGEAAVELPGYFEALNQDFRYQLTPMGSFSPLFVKQEIRQNTFHIAGGQPNMRVSWQVTGVRHDPFAEKNRVQVEVEKSAEERGLYLHPEAYQVPLQKSLSWQKQLEMQAKVPTMKKGLSKKY